MKKFGFFFFVFFLVFGLFPRFLCAFPNAEKDSLNLISSQADWMVVDGRNGDEFLFAAYSNNIFRIDLETWSLATDQVPALTDKSNNDGIDLSGNVAGLALRGNKLFASQSDGDLLTIDLDDVAADPTTKNILNGTLGALVGDTETDTTDDQLYILDKTNNGLLIYDISDQTTVSLRFLDSLGAVVAPESLVFVPFPTGASSGVTDKVYVTTNRGLLFVISEGATTATRITVSATNKNFPSAAVTPDGNYLLLVDSTDTVVHVMDTSTDLEVDTDSLTSGVNPISLEKNSALEGIAITEVSNPTDTYAYVTGAGGVSVIDLNLGPSSFLDPTVLDFNDEGSTDDEDDPLSLNSIPGAIVASPREGGNVYTSDSNAKISVISESPKVTISSTSLGTSSLGASDTFTITFQSDEVGTYQVLVGGGLDADGEELTSGTVDTVDTDVTTASIAYDTSLFEEGVNRIFVFVTDSSGHVGYDAVDVSVDTPPSEIEILGTGFGNEKVYVTFTKLTASDIASYNVYVGTTLDEVVAATTASATALHSGSGAAATVSVGGLTNFTTYFVGVEAVDSAGHIGVRTTTLKTGGSAMATPEPTVGLAESVGEAGCALIPASNDRNDGTEFPTHTRVFLFGSGLLILGMVLRDKYCHCERSEAISRLPRDCFITPFFAMTRVVVLFSTLLLFFFLFFPSAQAKETTPQWFSLELKGGTWWPRDKTSSRFLGSCCDLTGSAEFGFLYKSKFGIEMGAGYVGSGGNAVGSSSGNISQDRFDLTLIPLQNNITFRADFKKDQFFVPYIKVGPDYVIYRESLQGHVTRGIKFGAHGTVGLQLLMDVIEDLSDTMETSLGVNHIFLTLEARYAWVNNFGGQGLDLSNLGFHGGFLFEF